MKDKLRQLMDKVDARAPRERVLLIGAVLALIWLVFDHFLITPDYKRFDAARLAARSAQASLVDMDKAIAARDIKAAADKLALDRGMATLQARIEQARSELASRGASLVSAEHMTAMLDGVLRRHAKVRLSAMQNLPRMELGSTGGTPLYRHGVELTMEGDFAELMDYCRELEHLPQRLLWGPMSLSATEYPRVQLKLTLYTLSQDRPWLQL